ncbi:MULTISPECIES: YtpI family protein [unclassified Lysinibacillus]|uniref:YtpI family protein n=1 Tax=unclassified Lysinibacillus TaxID=2636778 RepID=UPI0025536814|nr:MULTISPECIES: YtpI family protein [unclassified Lysinibacillus]MDM5249747.1 YtpI family protein [Lysinibacillus sp. G4S2]
MLNLIFVFAIIISFAIYFYFKTKQFRSSLPIAKNWYKSKANVCFGLFILLFGLNQAYLFPGLYTFIIVAILVILGIFVIIENIKKARHYGQFVEEEFRINR